MVVVLVVSGFGLIIVIWLVVSLCLLGVVFVFLCSCYFKDLELSCFYWCGDLLLVLVMFLEVVCVYGKGFFCF